jgi:hypothetical protein
VIHKKSNINENNPMKTTQEYLTTTHANDIQWKKDLKFYKDEILLLRKRLEEVSAKNTSKEIKIMVSHFENQFIINNTIIDELNHEINLTEDTLAKIIKENPVAFEHKVIEKAELNGKIIIFQKIFAELKNSFNKFLAEVM